MASSETSSKFGDIHPLGHLLDDWAEWVAEHGKGPLTIEYDDAEDIFLVARQGRRAVLYITEIDADFYGEERALVAEAEIGTPPANLNWNQTLKFSGNELVLSRISLVDRDERTVLLVEGAVPLSRIDFPHFDLLVREVASIARDLRRQLAGQLENAPSADSEENNDLDEAEEKASQAG